jgi:hypothetical protein
VLCGGFGLTSVSAQQAEGRLPGYLQAEKFTKSKLDKMLFSTTVDPHWFQQGNNFWFEYKTSEGKFWYVVNPSAKRKELLFDREQIASQLTEIVQDPFEARQLPIAELKAGEDGRTFTFKVVSKAQLEIKTILIDQIIPNWYGTKWSFEGHTEIPKSGNIACGYFVSTTLRDAGFKLNRYKLAQLNPLEEAKIMSCGETITTIKNSSLTELKKHFLTLKDGIYFIGLDFHVGYILKEQQNVYIIHSNYINKQGVVKENIEKSKAASSSTYYIVPISNNQKLIKKWILNQSLN